MGDRKEAERERWRGVQWGGLKSHWSHGTNSVSSHNHCGRDKRWMPVCRIATAYQWFIIDSDSASGFNTTGQLEHQECRSSWSPLYRCSFGLFIATSSKQSRAYCAVHHLSYSSLNSSFCFLFTSLFFSPMWCVLLHSQVVSISSKSCRVPSLLCLYLSATIIISFHSYLHVHLLSFAHSYVGLDLHLILLKNRQYRLFSSTSSCLSGCVISYTGKEWMGGREIRCHPWSQSLVLFPESSTASLRACIQLLWWVQLSHCVVQDRIASHRIN